MTTIDAAKPTGAATDTLSEKHSLFTGTMIAALLAVMVAQSALTAPAVLTGLYQQDLGTTSSQLTWLADIFMIPLTIFELTFGVVGDLFGRKRTMLGGAVLMMIGEGMSFLTPGAGTSTSSRVLFLCAAQVIAGIGGAAMLSSSLALASAGARNAKERTHSIAIWAAVLGFGGLISPVVGGLTARHAFNSLGAHSGWRWTFVMLSVLAVVSAIGTLLLAKESSEPEGRSIDAPGQFTIAVSLFALMFAVIQGPSSGWGSTKVVVGFIAFAVFMAAFVYVELHVKNPLLQLRLFTNRYFSTAAVATVFAAFAFLGLAYATSIRLATVQGLSPLKTSIAFVLLNGMALVLVRVTSRMMTRLAGKYVLAIGFVCLCVGSVWLSQTGPGPGSDSIGSMIIPLTICGIGFAFGITSITEVAVSTVGPKLAGMASGATNMLRNLGFVLGPAVVGAVSLSVAAHRLNSKVAASPTLSKALASFTALPSHLTGATQKSTAAAVAAVHSGPLGANAVPSTISAGGKTVAFNPIQSTAYHSLVHAYSIGFLLCAGASLIAAVVVLVFMRSGSHREDGTAPAGA